MNTRRSISLFLIGVIITTYCSAQYFPVRQYMTSDGMPSNSVFDIAQHPSGMMWFVTKSGPTYYNGQKWHSFADSLNLPSSYNSKIIISDSLVWVIGLNKTTFTFQKYHTEWTKIAVPFPFENFDSHLSFNVFKRNNQYYCIIGAKSKLFIYDMSQDEWSQLELNNHKINNIHQLDEKWVITTSKGLYEIVNNELRIISLPYDKLPSKNILTLDYRKGVLYLLGFNWYAELENQQINFLLNDAGLSTSSSVNQSSLVVDQNGKVFFGSSTPARIINYENNTWQNLLIKGQNLNIGSTRIFCDKENNIWVSDSRGLFKFNVLQFLNYNESSGLIDDEVTAITELQDGSIFLANHYDFNILKDNHIDHYSYEIAKNLNYRNLSVAEDTINNRLFIATNDQGLLMYNKNSFINPERVFSGERLKFTSVGSYNGTIYTAGNSGIYSLVNDDLIKVNDNIGIRNITNIGNLLALSSISEGLYIYDGSTFRNYSSSNIDLSSVFQATIFEGDTLVATRDGVGIVEENELSRWNKVQINAPVYSLLTDSKKRLWIGSDHGAYLYQEGKLRLYDLDGGLSGNEINRNALFEDSNGQIWIGTEKGVSVFIEGSQFTENLNLEVDIVEIVTEDGAFLSAFRNNELPYDLNGIQVSFQCLSYIDEDKINFRYRVNHQDKWIEKSDPSNDIVFSNLGSGDYQFEIQARFGSDAWGPISSFSFSVKPPFYSQWWFFIFVFLLLAVIARVIFYFRYLYLIRKQRKLKNQVATRTKEITLLNEQLEKKVKERTQELENKNLQLEESAYLNAHHLRGPLTKMMSALQVAEISDDEIMDKKLFSILKESIGELDAVIYSINDVLSEQEESRTRNN
ncbi:ligand-binding sensor domain-containing protein [Ekhidna sp.]|uniref:ligand-binding sensor domain-containing protein n=1 Tax=Ekhidna sp. TaxID=2608089 RepID=UPI003BAB037E